jgi:hydrogenase 3 maturation protease
MLTALKQKLKGASKVLILGIGSELKGDDAAGILAAEKLEEEFEVIIGGTSPENFTGEIKRLKPSHLIIIDSAQMGEKPGYIRLIDSEEIGGLSFGTHALPLSVMINYLKEYFPLKAIIIGIQPKTLTFGAPPSLEVEDAITDICDSLKSIEFSGKMKPIQVDYKKDLLKAASLGLEIAVAVFLGAFIGYQIDIRLRSKPIGMIIGLVIGAIAGIWNAVRMGIIE